MSNLSQPKVNINVTSSATEVNLDNPAALLIGVFEPLQNVEGAAANEIHFFQNIDLDRAATLFSKRSVLYSAIRRFREHNIYTELDLIAMPFLPFRATVPADGNNPEIPGIPAPTKTIVDVSFVGTVTKPTSTIFRLYDDEFSIPISFAKDMNGEKMADALIAAINSKDDYPFIAKKESGAPQTVQVEFATPGMIFNNMFARVEDEIPGVGVIINSSQGGLGMVDDFSKIESRLENSSKKYRFIGFEENINPLDIGDFLKKMSLLENEVKLTQGVACRMTDYDQAVIYASNLDYLNITIFNNFPHMNSSSSTYDGKSRFNAVPLLYTSEFIAKACLRLTDGAPLGDLVQNVEEVAVGGMSKASLPYSLMPMSYHQPKGGVELSLQEVEKLEKAGANVLAKRKTRYSSELRQVYTTSKDKIFRTLNSVDIYFAIKEYLYKNFQMQNAQMRLSAGQPVGNTTGVSTVAKLKLEFIRYYMKLYDNKLVSLDPDDRSATINAFKTIINTYDGKATLSTKIKMMSSLEAIEFNLVLGK